MKEAIIDTCDPILVTGASGFIGVYVVETLLNRGYRTLRCFVRPSSNLIRLNRAIHAHPEAKVEIIRGNLIAPSDCRRAVKRIRVIYHLAAGRDKSFAGSFLNSVITTKNLLESTRSFGCLVRFVNVSSLAVYSNIRMKGGALLDESCPLEDEPQKRCEPYTYGKVKQEEIVVDYGRRYDVPYVIVRLGNVFGPGKPELTGRIGIDTFGVFLHLGGANRIPFTYVENCAEAIVMAGLRSGISGEVFNIVDDELPRSYRFLRMYKKNVRSFRSIWVPYRLFYLFCLFWEWYSRWSDNQLPPAFNTRRCAAFWKGNRYSNEKLKRLIGWHPKISFEDAAARYFDSLKKESII